MNRSTSIILVLVAIAAVGIGGVFAYENVLRGDSVAPLTLPSGAPSSAASSDPGGSPATTANASAATNPSPATNASSGGIAGTWTVATGEAGYRVRERLANLPAESDAVGRTKDVTGNITLSGSGNAISVDAGTITVNTTTIVSNESRRDDRMRTEGLQTDQYETATFVLTKPVAIPTSALTGTASDVTLTGDLTLHGVTKSVSIPAQAQLVNATVSVAGSLSFPLSDFSITPPNVGGFILSIADTGALEFSVSFAKS